MINSISISSVNEKISQKLQTLHKKWSGFGHIYWRNPEWKTSFFVQWKE